jgi:acylaminoacyl-peptidase
MTRFTALVHLAFSFLLGVLMSGDGFADGPGKQPLEPLDVFHIQYASDPQISPDGSRVAYVRNFMDVRRDRKRSHLWAVDADGGGHRPLVADDDRDASQPRWSPDGTRLAYVSKAIGEKDGPAQLYCRWMDTGQSARLAELEREPEHLAWSPDGRLVAFTMLVPKEPEPFVELPKPPKGADWAEPPRVVRRVGYRYDGKGYLEDGFRHVFVVSAEGGAPHRLTSGDFHHDGPLAWSGNGDAVYFTANRNEDWELEPRETELFRVSLADGGLTAITERSGPDHTPAVSPDGRRLAWLGFDDRGQGGQNTRLYVANADGGDRREIAGDLDRSVESPVWTEDGEGLVVKFDDRGTTKVARVALDGRVTVLAENVGGTTIGRPYASGSFSTSAAGRVAFTYSTPRHPADVAVVDDGGEPVRLTRLDEGLLAARQVADAEELEVESSVDGRAVQAWVVKPPDFDPKKKYPLILEIHGGPFANYGGRFSMEIQLYAAAGYVVLYANPRGSTGYGEEFANLIHHDYPGRDYDDLMDAVDAVVAKGFVDEDQLYVTGGSGGGVLTAWIVGKTNRFRAAVAAKPVINWYSFALTADAYPYFARYWFPGMPWEQAEHYLRRSPLSLVGNVTTPTMLITGEDDHRTPIAESEQFYQALKLRKVDTMLVRVPGASHDIVARPSRMVMKVSYVLAWFRSHNGAPREGR